MGCTTVGIIGAGRIGRIHADNLSALPDVKVKWISDVIPDQVAPWAQSKGIACTDDNQAILGDPEVDAIFICSSTNTHTELIEAAARAGKHIFCEKPISFDTAATRQALQAASEAGIVFQTGFNRRFDNNFSRMKQLIDEDAIGTPHIIRITSRDPAPPPYEYIKVSGGMFLDMSIHDFDMARFLSGSDVEEVYVAGRVLVDPQIGELHDVDTAIITLSFASGAIGVIDNSRKAVYGYDQRAEAFGSKGSVQVSNEFANSAVVSGERGVSRDNPKHFFLERYMASYKKEAEAFIASIRDGRAAEVSGYDGLQAELIAQAARLSWLENRAVRISEIN